MANCRNCINQEINAFAVRQAAHHHDVDGRPRGAPTRIRKEAGGVDSIGDHRDSSGSQRSTQHEILLVGMRDADLMVNVGQEELEQLVDMDACSIGESEQRVIRVHGLETHGLGMEQALMRQIRRRLMSMDNVYPLADQHLPYQGEEDEKVGKCHVIMEGQERQIIHLQAIRHVPDAMPAPTEVCDDDHLVAALQQALRELVDVHLDAAHAGMEEV
mmetsp:Transcript_102800/g.329700  ORF Transcript_102800/g.329700 Transcript_102800/m.329700 type:complete len:216 (-) Transcript_102800:157-804(-)|eukprot:CAMPEP_0204103770 /NCGR_PEP_ID=MMETSP0360-20130528/195647_1 /ASSEMBLY_ACC=CAM_ASM_000342 /TAXON_ID=268821 /ORGANISM="Scrippsiella Hangoei, Strain SHTV-5" /LENGTH=215 /DNA_ID=CAMNT_0051053189 /DNA_START=645 /DNA_END=1292 /DNA_ORIENTATION=+